MPKDNSVQTALHQHRSIRKYQSKPIPREVLDNLLVCGLRGSSSGNMNTWSVVVSQDREQREKLYKLHFEQEMIREAPVVLTFCADVRRMRRWVQLRGGADSFDDLTGYLTAAFDAVIVAQNVGIAAESVGLGFCYMGTTLWSAAGIAAELKLAKGVIPVTSMVLGYPAENPPLRSRLPISAFVHHEFYQDPTDDDLLSLHTEREVTAWQRYRANAALAKEMDELGVQNVAQFYTSQAKYPKSLHQKTSEDYLALLRKQEFWNF